MFGLEIIEVGIGLAFAYLSISLICSGIVDLGVSLTNLRSKHLKTALSRLLDDKKFNGFVKDLYDHHLISSPLKDKLGEPTHIEARHFASAVFDILSKGTKGITNDARFKQIEQRIQSIRDETVKKRLLAILNDSAGEVDTIKDKVETWFNDSMVHVSEWYRARMRVWVTVISVVVVGVMNADSLKMAELFWNDDDMRAATVSAAEAYTNSLESRMSDMPADQAADSIGRAIEVIKGDISSAKTLPIGWESEILPCNKEFDSKKDPVIWWMLKIAGLLLTVGAVSMGSTYWYKQIKSLMSLRFGLKGGGDAAATPTETSPATTPPAQPVARKAPAAPANSSAESEGDPEVGDGGEAGDEGSGDDESGK